MEIYVRKGEDDNNYDMINYIVETSKENEENEENETKSFLFRNRNNQNPM